MKSKIGIIIGMIGLIFSLSVLNAADEVNLLVNGDLQDGGGDNTPGWGFSTWNLKEGTKEAQVVKWGIVAEKGNEAKKCLWIGITAPAKAHIWFQQEVKCDPSETYTLSFRAKGNPNACGLYACSAKEWLTFESIKDIEPSTEWKTYVASFKTPDTAARIGVRLGVGADGQQCEVFFGDIKLVKGKTETAK